MCVLGWRSQQKVSSEETHKGAETCLPDDFISFSWHLYWCSRNFAQHNSHLEEFLLAEAVRGSYRITVSGLWHVNPIGSFGKTKSHVDVCNEARKFLPLLQMPADRIKKTKVFERNFECQIMDKKNAIRFESILNQSTAKVYTDGSKLNGRVGAAFYAEYPNNSPKQAFFHLGIYSTVFQAEVLAISEVAKNLLLNKMHNQSIVALVDSQAAIKALIKCTVTSITVLNCIRNLNQLGKQNHVSIEGFRDMQGFMVTKWPIMWPNQDLNQKCMVLNLLLQSRMPVVLARLRTDPQIDGNLGGINRKTA